MGTSLNVSVVGFVGSDPQVRTVQTSNGEQQVASFSVAVSRKNGGGQNGSGGSKEAQLQAAEAGLAAAQLAVSAAQANLALVQAPPLPRRRPGLEPTWS